MADVAVNSALQATGAYSYSGPQFTVWVSSSVGYTFFINSTKKVQYSKTTNGGSSWGAGVSVLDTGETTNGMITFAIWFDKWTAGDSGTLIHVVGNNYNSDLFEHRTLDTASDTLGTKRTIGTVTAGASNSPTYNAAGFCSVTKSRGGNLYAFCTNQGTSTNLFYRSTDSGANWSSRTSPYEATGDLLQLIPSNDTDNQDIACLYLDASVNDLTFKLYDDSANTWGTETNIDTAVDTGGVIVNDQFYFHGAIRHSDGKCIVAYWNDEDVNTSDLKVAVLTLTVAGANATALTDVISNVTEGGATTSVLIDQNTDTLYVGYLKGGTWESLVDVYWKSSTNNGSTWGTETKYNTTQDDYRNLSMGTSIKAGTTGRLYAVFIDDDDDDAIGNFDLSVAISTTQVLNQSSYRVYADGTESGSSALASQDTAYDADITSGDVNLGLRVRIQNTGGFAETTDDYQLQYELNDNSAFTNIGLRPTIDSFDGGSLTTTGRLNGTTTARGQSFVGTGSTLTAAGFYLLKGGSPTGNATVKIYATTGTHGTDATPSGAALATSDNFDVTTLTTSAVLREIAFSGGDQITLTNGTTYIVAVEYPSGDASNYIVVGYVTGNNHAGNTAAFSGGSWSTSTGEDYRFYLYAGSVIPVVGYNSASLTDGNATTNRLGSGSGSFVAGEISEDGLVDNLQITASNYTELLYSLTLESDALADNDTLDFRVLRNGAVLNSYSVTPRITITESTGATLVTQDTALALTIDNTTITQNHVLTAQDSALALTMDNTTITQNHVLATADIGLSLTTDNTTIAENHVLPVQDIALSLTEDNTTITQNHIVPVQDIALALTEDNTTVTETNFSLTVQDVALSLTEDNTTIAEEGDAFTLLSDDIALSLTEDNTALSQNHVLATQDVALALTEDNTTVAETNFSLAVQDVALALSEDNTTVVETNYSLVVDDIAINTSLEATSMSLAGDLNAQDSTLSLTIDDTTITQNHVLAVQDMALALTEDNTTLTQNHVVASNDIILSTTTDETTITQAHVLTAQDMDLSLTTDETTVAETNFSLSPQDISLSTRFDNASLQGELVEAKKYYIDSDGNVYWVINQALGLVEKV